MSISIRPMKNGNYRFSGSVKITESVDHWAGIEKNIVRPFLDNWQHYFNARNISIIRRKNGTVYLEKIFPNDLVLQLQDLGFKKHTQRIIRDRDIIEYRKKGNDIQEVDDMLYSLFKTNVEASEVISNEDIF